MNLAHLPGTGNKTGLMNGRCRPTLTYAGGSANCRDQELLQRRIERFPRRPHYTRPEHLSNSLAQCSQVGLAKSDRLGAGLDAPCQVIKVVLLLARKTLVARQIGKQCGGCNVQQRKRCLTIRTSKLNTDLTDQCTAEVDPGRFWCLRSYDW